MIPIEKLWLKTIKMRKEWNQCLQKLWQVIENEETLTLWGYMQLMYTFLFLIIQLKYSL